MVGRSNIVGKPIANMMVQKGPGANATVTIVHTRTKDLAAHCKRADILIVAAGVPDLVKPEWIKPGACVIDVGVNRVGEKISEWAEMSDYRLIFLKLTLIAVLFTLSLNIINGYMGEFSCSHPGFMAIGAYMSSLFTVGLFASDKVLGDAVFNVSVAYLTFPLALIFGGLTASHGRVDRRHSFL